MKRHNVILESNVEPKDNNVLWLQGKKLKKFGNTGWEDIGNEALALGAFHGYFPDSSSLPTDVTTPGYAYVGLDNPYKIWKFNGESWSDSGTYIDVNDVDEEDITRNIEGKLQFKDRAYGDGMGYVILRKNKSFSEQITKENTIYEIRYDFTLDKDIIIPNNCILKFNGGSIISSSNRLIGNLSNKDIYMSWFNGSISAISRLNLSNHTVLFDIPIEFDETFHITNVSNLKLDGCKNTINRNNGSFFICDGSVTDIEICNFVCHGNLNGDFFTISTNTVSSNIKIHDNYIETIRTGISFNAHNRNENEHSSCNNCIAENNTIIGNSETTSVGYYGLHIANANNCIFRNNFIKNVGRHSIYHAYGHNNSILYNIIENNGHFDGNTYHLPALNIVRDSKNVIIQGNIFRNNDGSDICIFGSTYDNDVTLELSKSVDGVYIIDNHFYHNTGMNWPGKYNIALGRPYVEGLDTNNIIIENNTFIKSQETGKIPFNIETVYNANISNNTIIFSGNTDAVIFMFTENLNPAHSFVNIYNNKYVSSGPLSAYIYSLPKDNLITKADYYKVITIKNNEYCNRRGSNTINYALYPSYTIDSLQDYPNLETGALIHNITTRNIQKDYSPNTGHYNTIGDIILTYTQGGTTSPNTNVMGFVCAADGNPGIWRPFGFNAMNFDIVTTGEGYPSGSWNGRLYSSQNTLAVAYGNIWYRGDGYGALNKTRDKLVRNSGQTQDRPVLNGGYDMKTLGFRFYDRTIGKEIHWCHDRWEESDGAEAGVARNGDTNSRPSGNKIYVGFMYFDTSLNKPIYAKEITSSPWNVVWVDATGTTV